MAQWLRVHIALLENRRSVPRTHVRQLTGHTGVIGGCLTCLQGV